MNYKAKKKIAFFSTFSDVGSIKKDGRFRVRVMDWRDFLVIGMLVRELGRQHLPVKELIYFIF